MAQTNDGPDAGRPAGFTDLIAAYQAIRGTGEAADGRVRVVVDGSSDLVELDIDPHAMRLAAQDLAAAIREAFGAARTEAQRAAVEVQPARLAVPEDARAMLSDLSTLAQRNLDGIDRLAESLARLGARTARS